MADHFVSISRLDIVGYFHGGNSPHLMTATFFFLEDNNRWITISSSVNSFIKGVHHLRPCDVTTSMQACKMWREMGQISSSHKKDKSVKFSDRLQYTLTQRAKRYWNLISHFNLTPFRSKSDVPAFVAAKWMNNCDVAPVPTTHTSSPHYSLEVIGQRYVFRCWTGYYYKLYFAI